MGCRGIPEGIPRLSFCYTYPMDLSEELRALESFAHAYVMEGDDTAHTHLLAHLARIGVSHRGNPDVRVSMHETLGIDESRALVQQGLRHPFGQSRSVVIVTAQAITGEAQNALLKTFEDPAAAVTFFLIVPSVETLLPTLRSRLVLLHSGVAHVESEHTTLAREFLRASRTERLKLLEPILKEKSLRAASELVREIERLLAPRSTEPVVREGLQAVYRAERYLGDKGSLKKVLLEQVALLVPQV